MCLVHPGKILREEYLAPMGMSVHALAQALRVPATRLHEIVKERRSIALAKTPSLFALSLMELLAIRLSPQACKSLVMSKGSALINAARVTTNIRESVSCATGS